MKLRPLRILVTRPRPQGEQLYKKLQEIGAKPIYFPLIDIVPPDDTTLLQKSISLLDHFNWLIFISPQAVIQSMAMIQSSWITFPEHVKIAAIGQGTAATLQAAGLPVISQPVNDWCTEGLLELPEFQHLMHQKIAIVCGAGGRTLLADKLRERGAEVSLLVAYQRQLPKIERNKYIHLFSVDSLDIIVITSQESLQNLLLLVGEEHWLYLFSITLVVISERIAAYAKEKGFQKIVIAKNASHEQILHAITEINKGNIYGK
jgi:uroporphyrinogen-III synthase